MTAGSEAERYEGPAAILQDGNVVLVLCSLPPGARLAGAAEWSGRFRTRDPGDEVDRGPATLRLASGASLEVVVTAFAGSAGTLASAR